MTKEQWLLELKWLEKLEKNLKDSDLAGYMEHKNLYKEHVEDIPELFVLVTGGENINDDARAFTFSSFLKHGHHDFDIKKLREGIQSKIQSL